MLRLFDARLLRVKASALLLSMLIDPPVHPVEFAAGLPPAKLTPINPAFTVVVLFPVLTCWIANPQSISNTVLDSEVGDDS